MNDELDVDRFLAERAYLRERTHHIRTEFQDVLDALGTGLSADRVTDADMVRLREQYLSALREAGNPGLAQRWLAADDAWQAAQAHLEALNDAHRSGRREVPPAEWLSARDAMNDALEAFERINAEAGAWLRGHQA